MSFAEDQFVAISALQHWLYCPRQCALIHLEQAWAENRFTAEGNQLHKKAHDGQDETRADVRITRGMPVSSARLGISGQCDVVEFRAADGGNLKSALSLGKSALSVLPVEYKRGKPKAHRADEVQLCAQALCLEEMLGVEIPGGCLFYGERRRRMDVCFDPGLRALVEDTARAIRECLASGRTPAAEYLPRRCDACSLIGICKPQAMRFKKGAAAWFSDHLKSQISNLKSSAP